MMQFVDVQIVKMIGRQPIYNKPYITSSATSDLAMSSRKNLSQICNSPQISDSTLIELYREIKSDLELRSKI